MTLTACAQMPSSSTRLSQLMSLHRSPAWNLNRNIDAWYWYQPFEGHHFIFNHPAYLDSSSSFSNFLCSQEPCDSIFTNDVPDLRSGRISCVEVFGILQRSPATAEGQSSGVSSRFSSSLTPRMDFQISNQNTLLAFGCGPLSLAALEGNPEKMKYLLRDYPNSVNEVNLLNQTPLHLAVGHSSCVELLLGGPGRDLLDLPDSAGMRPMEYAVYSCLCGEANEHPHYEGCLKNRGDTSLVILLNADCMVSKPASWPPAYSPALLCNNCLRTITPHLVNRRERLKSLAINHLPRIQADVLGLFSAAVLDSNATRVIQSLKERGISVPTGLQVPGSDREGCNELSSAYHRTGALPFSLLWDSGFRDVDTPDADGLTPLMLQGKCLLNWEVAAACSWLIENGANPWDLTPEGISTVGHELYASIGKEVRYPSLISQDSYINLTGKLSQRDPRDKCRCACSPGGCTPFVRFLQAALGPRYNASALGQMQQLPEILTKTHASITTAQVRSAIRLATFEMLGIRHTCCHPNWRWKYRPSEISYEELHELRQEDCSLVDRLEYLIDEFEVELEHMRQERYVNKNVSFWNGYWLPRMEQVLESIESDGIDEVDRAAAEDIGVVWHKKESGKNKDSGSEDGRYHESDWDSEIDAREMFETFRTMDDWTSRLDLIMSKAGLCK